jgi:four helix bundle protein
MVLRRGYTDLQAWQKSMDFVDAVYTLTRSFPKDEMYGLCSQIRRSAVSIPANLAEGCSRDSTKEFIRFVNIALGSMAETETHLLIASRQGYMTVESLETLLEKAAEIGRMMQGLRKSLEKQLQTNVTSSQPLVAAN